MQQAYWGFPIDTQLYQQASTIIAEIQAAERIQKAHNKALSDLVYQMVKAGLEAYYHEPTRRVSMSAGMKKSIDGGLKVITGAIKIVIGQFFSSLDAAKLQAVSQYVEQLLAPSQTGPHATLIFRLDGGLHQNLSARLGQVQSAPLKNDEVQDLVNLMQQVVDVCIHHYYRAPTDLVELKGLSRNVSDLGIRNVQKAFDAFLDRLLSRLEHEEMVALSGYLESLLHYPQQAHPSQPVPRAG